MVDDIVASVPLIMSALLMVSKCYRFDSKTGIQFPGPVLWGLDVNVYFNPHD